MVRCKCGNDLPEGQQIKCNGCGLSFVEVRGDGDVAWEASNTVNNNVEYYDFSISRKSARVWYSRSQDILFSETRVKKHTW